MKNQDCLYRDFKWDFSDCDTDEAKRAITINSKDYPVILDSNISSDRIYFLATRLLDKLVMWEQFISIGFGRETGDENRKIIRGL